MIKKSLSETGFSIIEMMLVLAIFFLLFYLAAVSFNKLQQKSLFQENLQQIVSVIRKTQNKAQGGESLNNQHLKFGIIFNANSYQEFATFTDFNQRQTDYDLINLLPETLNFTSLNLPDTCLAPHDCLLYAPIEATPSAAASLVLQNPGSLEKETIYINHLGQVSY